MKLTRIYLLFILAALFSGISTGARAQKTGEPKKKSDNSLVQLSGVIAAPDGKSAIPYATVNIMHSYRGTIAGPDGFYSLVVGEKDTVEYRALGFKKAIFVLPFGIIDQKLTHNVALESDTLVEPLTRIPYLTPEEFKQAFLNLKLQDDLTEKAKKNLDQETMRTLYETLAKDGQESQLYTLQQIASSSYYAGGQKNYAMLGNGVAVPTSLLNPFAWAAFIKEIKDGKYKKKKKDRSKSKDINGKNIYDY
jgi:hypothetical protein